MRQSLALVVIGLVRRLRDRACVGGSANSLLFELSPHDPGSLAAAGTLLLVVALGSCVPPAMRALRVDAVEGLRAE